MNRSVEFLNMIDRVWETPVPAEVMARAKRSLLDYLAVTCGGAEFQKEKLAKYWAFAEPEEGRFRSIGTGKEQAKAICDYLEASFENPNDYRLHVNAVLDGLRFSPDPDDTDVFEKSMMELGRILGFESTRPEKETAGQGPDNLWAIGNGKYLVIECKSGATTSTISKNDCNRLGGAVRWFSREHGPGFSCTPIMVHKSTVIHNLAVPVNGMRIIDVPYLEALKNQAEVFSVALVQGENWKDERNTMALLQQYQLRSQDLVVCYSKACRG